MSYEVRNYMLVGFPYEDRSFIERAVEHLKAEDTDFKKEYETQEQVVALMPKYQSDLESLNQYALGMFYDYLDVQGVVRVTEQHGFDYIGFRVDDSVSTDSDSLNQFCAVVKEKSKDLHKLLGRKGALLATHDYS